MSLKQKDQITTLRHSYAEDLDTGPILVAQFASSGKKETSDGSEAFIDHTSKGVQWHALYVKRDEKPTCGVEGRGGCDVISKT